MMRALLRKDVGVLKDTILAALALHIFSYIMAAVLLLTGDEVVSLGKILAGGASLSRFTTVLICALVGGHICGREREELSIEFLRQMPVGPRSVFLSKLLVSVGFLSLVWLGSMGVLVLGMLSMGFDLDANVRVLLVMLAFLSCGVMSFGCAWYASSVIVSAVGASFAGLVCVLPVLAVQFALRQALGDENGVFLQSGAALFMVFAGVLFLVLAYRRSVNHSLGQRQPKNSASTTENAIAPHLVQISGPVLPTAFAAVVAKDFLSSRTAILIGLCTLLLPYFAVVAGAGLLESPLAYLHWVSMACIGIGVFVSVYWASTIITVEHVDRSIEFFAFLPIRSRDIVLSKLLVAFAPILIVVVLNAGCLVLTHNAMADSSVFGASFTWENWNQSASLVSGLALANGTLVAFALSWIVGARFRRPAPAVVAGIIAVPFWLMVWASMSTMAWESDAGLNPVGFVTFFSASSVMVCAVGLAVGSTLYLRPESA